MKLIIAGSRDYDGDDIIPLMLQAISDSGFIPTEIVCGMAPRGIDRLSYNTFKNKGPLKEFWPDWDRFHKKAGIFRNCDMGDYADAAVILWDGKSPGSAHMASYMKRLKKPYIVYTIENFNLKVIKDGRS